MKKLYSRNKSLNLNFVNKKVVTKTNYFEQFCLNHIIFSFQKKNNFYNFTDNKCVPELKKKKNFDSLIKIYQTICYDHSLHSS